MSEKLKFWLICAVNYIMHLYSTGDLVPAGSKRAYFISFVIESAIGLLIFAIMFGTIAMPQFLAVSTVGWGTYAPLLWAIIPLCCIAAFIVRMINAAKAGWVGPITGSHF
jgi:hypothetical protein